MKAHLLRHFIGLALLCASLLASAQTVSYNGKQLQWDDDQPYMAGGTIMLPARDTMDRVNGLLERNENGKRIELLWNSSRVTYRQGDRTFSFNGKTYNVSTASQSRNGVLFLPFEIFSRLTNGQLTRGGGGGGGGGGSSSSRVFFDNRPINLTGNVAPYRKDGILMVPFRALGDAIGATTGRTADGKRVTINFGDDTLVYDKGHIWYRMNNQKRDLQTISEDRGSVMFVPVTLYQTVTRGRVSLR
jgi:hypothetical protein